MTTQPLIMEENGKRYRLLNVGERIEEGDEVCPQPHNEWYQMDEEHFGQRIAADASYAYPYGYYRRPIVEDAFAAEANRLKQIMGRAHR